MPELTLEIGGRLYEVACNPGQEKMLENAASLLDAEAQKIGDSSGTATEKRMLLLAGLMIGDNLTSLEKKLAEAEEQIHAAEERIRIAEAKSAMLATSALKRDTDANASGLAGEVTRLKEENDAALDLLSRVLDEVNAMASAAEASLSASENA